MAIITSIDFSARGAARSGRQANSGLDDAAEAFPRRINEIGRYRIDSLISVGGMGSIYLGLLTGAAEFSRRVAIKRLHPQLANDPQFRLRLVEEARLNARVMHPNVAQLLDVVESAGELWLVMEYIDGETLHALQTEMRGAGRVLPLDVVASIMSGVLEGLHAAHETVDSSGARLGIVHRDISPQNIMISRCGQVKLIDFGIAKAASPAVVSGLNRLVGKVSYMSPEQARGDALDRRSDVFAAGIVLWEALTGKRLFREAEQSQAAILRDVLRKPVPAPSTLRSDVPLALDAVVMRALQRDPSCRFGSAREFAHALEAAVPLAPATKLSAYLIVFCEARLEQLSLAQGRTPANAPPQPRVAKRPRTDDEELTSLALTKAPAATVARQRWRLSRWSAAIAVPLLLFSLVAVRNGKKSTPLAAAPVMTHRTPVPTADHAVTPAWSAMPAPQRAPDPAPTQERAAPSAPLAQSKVSKPRRTPSARSRDALRAVVSNASTTVESAPAEPNAECSPPTYLGRDGIQHFKAQCL